MQSPLSRQSESLLLSPVDINPTHNDWTVLGVFNPAVTMTPTGPVILARVAECPSVKRPGVTGLPRFARDGRLDVDWFRDTELQPIDARVVRLKESGHLRLTSVSHLQILRQLGGANSPWQVQSHVMPQGELEEFGIEDPRITLIDTTYWITYVAVSRRGALTQLMSSKDMVNFQRHGIIFPCENKDVVLFSETFENEFLACHRPNPHSHFCSPQIWLARSPDLLHWGSHHPLVSGQELWEADRVGSGPPPVLLPEGWLLLYHGSARSKVSGQVGTYAVGAVLLDREQPHRVLARSSDPIIVPTSSYETSGFVPGVVFPTAVLDAGDDLQVFYGAADTCVAVMQLSKDAILNSMTKVSQ